MSDSDLIEALGGPSRVAGLLGYAKAGGVQRVQNWKVRGIPARVKLQRPDLFLSGAPGGVPDAPAASAQPTGAAHAA